MTMTREFAPTQIAYTFVASTGTRLTGEKEREWEREREEREGETGRKLNFVALQWNS